MEPIISYWYSIPYLCSLFFLIVLLFYEFNRINKKRSILRIQILVGVWFLFFFGLRGYILEDWSIYYYYYQNLPTLWNLNWGKISTDGFEIGFVWYTILIKSLFLDYHQWIFISTLFDFLVLNWFIKKYSCYYVISFILFFSFMGISLEVDTMRNMKSMMFFLLSIPALYKRDSCKYLEINIIGCTFHLSSIIYLPLYWILCKQTSNKLIWGIFFFMSIAFIYHMPFMRIILTTIGGLVGGRINDRIVDYTLLSNYIEHSYGLSIGFFERLSTYCLVAYFYRKDCMKTELVFFNIYILYFFVFMFFSEIQVLTSRFSLLFIIGYWIVIPNIYKYPRIRNKRIMLTLILLICLFKVATSTNKIIYRYENLLFGISSVTEKSILLNRYHEL